MEITIDGIQYVPKSQHATTEYSMVRTRSAGVFCGVIESRTGMEAVLRDARRMWYWDGAASLSELATLGTSKPKTCKFPMAVDSVTLSEVIEIIPVTAVAKASIDMVPTWTQH